MRKWSRRRYHANPWNALAIVLAGAAGVFVYGLFQTETSYRSSDCTVRIQQPKTRLVGLKKPVSRRLECDNYVIALKNNDPNPGIPEQILTDRNIVACSFEIDGNPYRLRDEHIVTESISCSSKQQSDTG